MQIGRGWRNIQIQELVKQLQGRSAIMNLILLIVVILLLFGGGGGYYAYNNWGPQGGIGIVGIVLIIIVVLFVTGRGRSKR
jgi:hypothetical protein